MSSNNTVYYCSVLEVRRPTMGLSELKPKCGQSYVLLEAPGKNPFPWSLQFLEVPTFLTWGPIQESAHFYLCFHHHIPSRAPLFPFLGSGADFIHPPGQSEIISHLKPFCHRSHVHNCGLYNLLISEKDLILPATLEPTDTFLAH